MNRLGQSRLRTCDIGHKVCIFAIYYIESSRFLVVITTYNSAEYFEKNRVLGIADSEGWIEKGAEEYLMYKEINTETLEPPSIEDCIMMSSRFTKIGLEFDWSLFDILRIEVTNGFHR